MRTLLEVFNYFLPKIRGADIIRGFTLYQITCNIIASNNFQYIRKLRKRSLCKALHFTVLQLWERNVSVKKLILLSRIETHKTSFLTDGSLATRKRSVRLSWVRIQARAFAKSASYHSDDDELDSFFLHCRVIYTNNDEVSWKVA